MDLARHCELCDNQIIDLKIGTTCKLNNKKPEFNKTCSKIELNEKFEEKLKIVNANYQNIKNEKGITYLYFIIFFLISISIIVGGYLLGKYGLEKGVISTVPIIIMGVGLIFLSKPFGVLNNHKNEISISKKKKENIDEVLNLYNIRYEMDIQFGKEIHGDKEVYIDLKINKR